MGVIIPDTCRFNGINWRPYVSNCKFTFKVHVLTQIADESEEVIGPLLVDHLQPELPVEQRHFQEIRPAKPNSLDVKRPWTSKEPLVT